MPSDEISDAFTVGPFALGTGDGIEHERFEALDGVRDRAIGRDWQILHGFVIAFVNGDYQGQLYIKFGKKEILVDRFGKFGVPCTQMLPTLSKLSRLSENVLVDSSALDLVRFDEDGPAVHLMFKNGTSATVHGKDASEMRSLFMSSAGVGGTAMPPDVSSEPTEGHMQAAVGEHQGFIPDLDEILSSGKKKAWFYRTTEDGKHLILACANVGGSCSVRLFDAQTGLALSKRYGSGSFREFFSDLIDGATGITVDSQPNLARECKQRLPERVFTQLRQQIDHIA